MLLFEILNSNNYPCMQFLQRLIELVSVVSDLLLTSYIGPLARAQPTQHFRWKRDKKQNNNQTIIKYAYTYLSVYNPNPSASFHHTLRSECITKRIHPTNPQNRNQVINH